MFLNPLTVRLLGVCSITRLGEMLCASCGFLGTCPRRFLFPQMYFCYLDESGTPELTAQTSHFVLMGLAIPASAWHPKDRRVNDIKARYGLRDVEIHTGYIARRFPEAEHIANFDSLDSVQRRSAVHNSRNQALIKAAALRSPDKLKHLKKLYNRTDAYIHLTFRQRTQLLCDLADEIGSWTDARLFGEAVEKAVISTKTDIFAQSFEMVVTRFHYYLIHRKKLEAQDQMRSSKYSADNLGLLIQDNNETVAKSITGLMRRFHKQGTLWAKVERIIETPLFVDSSLTSMVQMADLCAYATRRFFENAECDLFDRIFNRFDKADGKVVGLRHFVGPKSCTCKVCLAHRGHSTSMATT
jgi:hypothetical protein